MEVFTITVDVAHAFDIQGDAGTVSIMPIDWTLVHILLFLIQDND